MNTEDKVRHETPNGFWVFEIKKNVFNIQMNDPRPAPMTSVTMEAYADLSLAIARADYLDSVYSDADKREALFDRLTAIPTVNQ